MGPSHSPQGALSKRRAPGFMEGGSETHLQALLSFHLQEKRDLRWCLARTLTSSSHIQQQSQPTFPPGEKYMKAIANSSAAGERLLVLPSEVLALGSVEIATNHTDKSRGQRRWLPNNLGLLPPQRMQRGNQILFNDLTLPLGTWYQGGDISVVVMSPWATAAFCT